MESKSFVTKFSLLAFAILTSLAIIYFYYNKLKVAENNLSEYRLAISCPNKGNCREKHEAVILESNAKVTHIISIPRAGTSIPSIDSIYVFSIDSPVLGDQTIEISANPPTIGTPFDIGNVRIPPDSGPKFIQENFFHGETVYIETWRSQIIFLYVDAIIEFPEVTIKPTPFLESPEQQTTLSPLPPKTYEIAMPTSIHPIFLHTTAQNNFFAASLLCPLFTGAIFVLMFKKR